jgi:hypothetical protein
VRGTDNEVLKVPEIRSVKSGEAIVKPFRDGLKMGALPNFHSRNCRLCSRSIWGDHFRSTT